MLKILANPRGIPCFPGQELGSEVLGDQWSGMTSRKSHKWCTVSRRLPGEASLTVAELKMAN